MSEKQLDWLRDLSERVQETFVELADLEDAFLSLQEQHRLAKDKLTFAIDDAYERGEVQGKNERERDANLRHIFRIEHNDVARLEASMRDAERKATRKRVDGQRLSLQVQLARMTLDAEINFAKAKSVVE